MQGSRRRIGATALALGLIGGLGVLAASPASAAASGTITSPSNGASFKTNAMVNVEGTVTFANGDSGNAVIRATDPDNSANANTGCSFQVASTAYKGAAFGATSADVDGTLDLASAYPQNCPAAFIGKPAVNGTWALTMTTGSGTSVMSFFTTAVPPVAPADVKATSTAPLSVTMTWTANPELDTHAYTVLNAAGQVVAGPADGDDVCSGTTCTTTFSVAGSGSQSFAVQADRYTTPPNRPTTDVTGDLKTNSSPQTVNVVAKPVPTTSQSAPAGGTAPSASAAAGAGGAGGTGTSPQPGSTSSAAPGTTPRATATAGASPKASAKAPSIVAGSQSKNGSGAVTLKSGAVSGAEAAKISAQFKDFAPPVGIDKLPPLPKLDSSGAVTELPAIAAADDGEPTDQGTFKLSLGYAPETTKVATTTVSPGAPLSFVADAIGISPSALWRSLAGSLVLLLLAGHVRRWARQPIE